MYNIQTQLNLWYALYIIGGIREANSHEAGDQKYMITIEDRAMGVFLCRICSYSLIFRQYDRIIWYHST